MYLCLQELWLRKCFSRVTFINTSLCNDIIRILKSETELDELDDDTTDVFKAGIIEKDCQRVSGSDNTVKNICLAEFAAWYTTKTIDQNDYQPSQLPENASFGMSSPLPFTREYIYIYIYKYIYNIYIYIYIYIYSISAMGTYRKENLLACLTVLPT